MVCKVMIKVVGMCHWIQRFTDLQNSNAQLMGSHDAYRIEQQPLSGTSLVASYFTKTVFDGQLGPG